jgi:hypothetical protein
MRGLILGAGFLGVSIALAGDRLVIVYGAEDAGIAALREAAHAVMAGAGAPEGVRVAQVEGSRVLTAEHSPQAGTRAFVLADGGGVLLQGFNPNGAMVAFRVLGAEGDEDTHLAKQGLATGPILPTYVSALRSVSLVSGRMRVDYTQAKPGKVQVEVVNLNGKILNRSSWQGDPGRHSQSMNLNVPRRQVVFLRWTDGEKRQVQKIMAR